MKNKNIESMSTRFAIALTLIVAFASVASAKKKSVIINGREFIGFNAINHVLQKPLGNPSFPEDEKGFGQHLYFGINGGASYSTRSYINKGAWELTRPGYKFGAHFGGWITPVHGIRLTGNYGKYSTNYGTVNPTYGSIRADYMMNLSSLLYGYDSNRKFELLGAMGLIYQYINQNGSANNNFGVATSLQMRFNLANSFYLFLEPEVAVLEGNKPNIGRTWSHMNTDLALNVGVGYNILTGKQRLEGSTKFEQSPEDNIFYGVAGGLFTFNNPGAKINSSTASLFMGKMFSSTSGIQFTGRYSHIKNAPIAKRRNIAMATVDYVFNMNNAFLGYRPNEVFQMLLNVGPSIEKSQNSNKFYAGVHAGVTGLFRLSHNWGIFVSPQIYGFANKFNTEIGMGKKPMLAIDLGLRYTVGDFSRRFKNAHLTGTDSIQRWFFNAAIGGGLRPRFGQRPLFDAYVGIGKRFTPISSWRLNLDGEYIRNYGRLTANIDYLSNITTAMMGYKENRVFDLQAVAGLFAGGAKYTEDGVKATFGAKAGFQANFRITHNLGIYIEPQILAVYGPYYKHNYMVWSPDARMQFGLKYNW